MKPVEVIMRTERRRKFSDAFRRRVVVETENPDVTIVSVAQKYDLALSLIHKWRVKYLQPRDTYHPDLMLDQTADSSPSWPSQHLAEAAPDFVYAGQVDADFVAQPQSGEGRACSNTSLQRIEIILPNGLKLNVGDQFNGVTLLRLLRVLSGKS